MRSVKILLDSISTKGARLTTFELTYPQASHAQLLTHRSLSRNPTSAPSLESLIEQVANNPSAPLSWGRQVGRMTQLLDPDTQATAEGEWIYAASVMAGVASNMVDMGVHDRIVNRLLEPFTHVTVIVSATTFESFFRARCNDPSKPDLQFLASEMNRMYRYSNPTKVPVGQWHLPLINNRDREEFGIEELKRISAGRCARGSTAHTVSAEEDMEIGEQHAAEYQMSPFEHVAQATFDEERPSGNYRGWVQLREDMGAPAEERKSTVVA